MNMKNVIVACSAMVLVAAASFVRSDPTGPVPVLEPGSREMRQSPPAGSRPGIGDRLSGLLSGTRSKAERGTGEAPPVPENVPAQIPSQESIYLKDIAARLSVPVGEHDGPGDIAFKIERRLGETARYRGPVLSDENARDVKAQILEESDAETFAEYHAFIKKIEGKQLLILETNE